jgi:hypothetical protein
MVTAASWHLLSLEYCAESAMEHPVVDPDEDIRLRSWLDMSERYGATEFLAVNLAECLAQAPVIYYAKDISVPVSKIIASSWTHLVKLWVERFDAGRLSNERNAAEADRSGRTNWPEAASKEVCRCEGAP